MRVARILFGLILAAAVSHSAHAAERPAFKRWVDYTYTIRSAELIDVTERMETEITSATLVQSLGQQRLSNNDRYYDEEIVEAATIKPDGRRIDVDRDQIAVLSGSESATNILIQADIKTRVVPFPDLEAGDRTLIVLRITQKQPFRPGGNMIAMSFPSSLNFTAVNVTVQAPKDLPLQISERAVRHDTDVAGDQQTLRWKLDEQPYAPLEASATAPIDWAPTLIVSTYANWEALGNAQFALSDPKSEPDDQILKLADQITAGMTDRRAQATAIFNWVATNIRYYDVVLNQGGFVPHDASQTLKNRYGDCKDHATLMRALLRAKGIAADYVLINAQSKIFRSFEVPMVGFDHMILYLPEFAIYADPTAATASLGVLPGREYDRPVLRFGASGVVWTRTPALSANDVKAELEVEATIGRDGQVSGTNVARASGPLAIELRNAMRQIETNGSATVGKSVLAKQNWTGTATFDTHSPFERSEIYEIKSRFDLTSRMFGDGVLPSAIPTGPRLLGRPFGPFAEIVRENRQRDYVCWAGTYSETIRLKLPEGKTLTNLPKGESVTRPLGEYQSSYRMDGNVLVVSRTIIWRVPSSVCTRQMADEVAAVYRAIDRDMGSRLQFADAKEIVVAPAARDAAKDVPATTSEMNAPE
jgi:transglutaminase-like putative cysteine protease